MLTRSHLPRRLRRRRFRCLEDAKPLVAALPPPEECDEHGEDFGLDFLLLDRRGRLLGLGRVVDLGDVDVAKLVDTVASSAPRGVWGPLLGTWRLLIVSCRPERPVDTGPLELAWEEACATARGKRLELLDWLLLVEDRYLYSVPEFAPSRPIWSIRHPTATRLTDGRA